jgi:hypothetical protein
VRSELAERESCEEDKSDNGERELRFIKIAE